MKGALIYLLGYPGVGKYTIGKEVARLTGARLVDNHLVNNPVFMVLGADGLTPIPPRAWELVSVIRETVLQAMAELAEREASFILTNVVADVPEDVAIFERIQGIAEERESLFVPVLLSCTLQEHRRRMVSPARRDRMKWVDGEALEDFVTRMTMYLPPHPNTLQVAVDDLEPGDAARTIVAHVERRRSAPAG